MSPLLLLFVIPLVCVLPGVVAVVYGRGLWVIITVILSAIALVFLPFEILLILTGPGLSVLLVLLLSGAASARLAVAEQQRSDQVCGVARSPLGASALALRSVKVVATGALFLALVVAGIEAWLWLSEPPMIRDIVGGLFRPPLKNGKEIYKQRVQATFPVKIPEAELLTLLGQQGYDISSARNNGQRYAAIWSSSVIVCRATWGVTWRVDNAGLVSELSGDVYSVCL
jgi:hypothetical protein